MYGNIEDGGEHAVDGMTGPGHVDGVQSDVGEENTKIKVSTSVQYSNLLCERVRGDVAVLNPVPGDVCEEETVCMGGVDDDGGGHAPDAEIADEVLGLEMTDVKSDERLRDFIKEDRRLDCSLVGEFKTASILDEKCEGVMKNLDRHAKSDAEAVPGLQL